MKIRNWVLGFLFVLGASGQAHAQSEDVYVAALQVCQNAPKIEMIDRCKSAVGSRNFFEKAVFDVCQRAPTWDMIIKCFRTGAGQTDPLAVEICNRAPTWDQIVSCFGSIADKSYVDVDFRDCQSRPTWDAILACFKVSGRPASNSIPLADYAALRAELRKAIQQIQSGDSPTAVRTLERVLIDLP